MTAPSPEAFLAEPSTDEDDFELEQLGVTMGNSGALEPSPFDWPNGPLESMAASLRTIAESVTRRDREDVEADETRQALDQLDAEYAELERLHDAKQALIEETLAICSKSTSKLANAIRAVLEPVVTAPEPEPSTAPAALQGEQPAADASIEEWREYAYLHGIPANDMNRSQIRTALGLPHFDQGGE